MKVSDELEAAIKKQDELKATMQKQIDELLSELKRETSDMREKLDSGLKKLKGHMNEMPPFKPHIGGKI